MHLYSPRRPRAAAFVACPLVVIATFAATDVDAAYIPVGVQQNVSVNTVLNDWGWSIAYQGTYAASDVPIGTVFNGVSGTDYVMYAARPTGSSTFTLLAAAPSASVRTYTSHNATTTANGVAWYYNGGSIGFAAQGQAILQNTADVSDTGLSFGGGSYNAAGGATRLSWHTNSDYGVQPTQLKTGWRAGNAINLNFNSGWERFVLRAAASGGGGLWNGDADGAAGAGGNWSTGGNWSAGFAPSSFEEAVFNVDAAYTVTLAADAFARDVIVPSGNVTLALGTHKLQAADDLVVSGGTLNLPATLKAGTAAAGQFGFGGELALTGGTLRVASLDLGGDPTSLNWTGGTLALTGNGTSDVGALGVPVDGTLRAAGTVVGNVTNLGVVDPGDSAGDSTGTLTVEGNYATLDDFFAINVFQINGTADGEFDKLVINGDATFSSDSVMLIALGFTPEAGDSFDLMDVLGDLAGTATIDTMTNASLPEGLAWDTSAFWTTGVLSVVGSPIAAVPSPAAAGGAAALLGVVGLRRRRA